MAEKEETSAEDFSCLPPTEPNTLAVGKLIFLVSSPTTASHSPPTLAWQRDVDFKSPPPPPPPPPSPPSFTLTSLITAFRNLFRSQKVKPTGIRPKDAKCDECQVAVLYNEQYNIHGTKKLGILKQQLLFDKPARVFSAIEGSYVAIVLLRIHSDQNNPLFSSNYSVLRHLVEQLYGAFYYKSLIFRRLNLKLIAIRNSLHCKVIFPGGLAY